MKRPEYVAVVTNIYRRALDGEKVTKEMMNALLTAFNRQGFTDGYYSSRLGADMFGIREEKSDEEQWMRAARQTYEGVENPLVNVAMHLTVRSDLSSLTVIDPEGRRCTVMGPEPERARTQELTAEQLQMRLSKTGGTPYCCARLTVDLTPGLTISAAGINAMRRDALNQLTALRSRKEERHLMPLPRLQRYKGPREAPGYTIYVTAREQITPRVLKMAPLVLYVPIHILAEDEAFTRQLCANVRVAAALPRIIHDGQMPKLRQQLQQIGRWGVKEALVGNLGLMLPVREAGMAIRGDFGLNIYNSVAMAALHELEAKSATLSFEMTLPQVRDISKTLPTELLVYGRMPLMVTENCLIRGKSGECACHQGITKLVDKTGAEFPVIRDGNSCRSVLLNGKKLNWLDRQKDLAKLGLWAMRLNFTTENAQEVDRVLQSCIVPVPFDPGACTRGLYLRGLE